LNFSRTSPTELVTVDLNKVIRETLTLMEHQLLQASVEVKLNLDERLPRIKGNAGKLQQVFLNLVLNARDAMNRRATRHPHLDSDGWCAPRSADTGAGIAAENLSRIFDPFFTTKAARKGTGLASPSATDCA